MTLCLHPNDPHVTVRDDGTYEWAPTNADLFRATDLWFDSEDAEFGDSGYGRAMPLWYLNMIGLGHPEEAFDAYGKRGLDALEHFESSVDRHITEMATFLANLQAHERPAAITIPEGPTTTDNQRRVDSP